MQEMKLLPVRLSHQSITQQRWYYFLSSPAHANAIYYSLQCKQSRKDRRMNLSALLYITNRISSYFTISSNFLSLKRALKSKVTQEWTVIYFLYLNYVDKGDGGEWRTYDRWGYDEIKMYPFLCFLIYPSRYSICLYTRDGFFLLSLSSRG